MPTQLRAMIAMQPDVLEAVSRIDVSAAAATLRRGRHVSIVGTGTSFHAAELGAYLFRSGGIGADAIPAATMARWRPVLGRDDAIILISHTGSTAYALSVREAAAQAGVPLVTITGRESDWDEAIKTPAQELSETYTVSYTAALGVLGLLGHALAGTSTGPGELREAAIQVKRRIASPGIQDIPVPTRALALAGPGPWAVTAAEGALKIRESARILAEGFDPERLLHGYAVPYGPEDILVGLQPGADTDGLTAALLQAAAAEGITIRTLENHDPTPNSFIAQLTATVQVQLLAAHLTDLKGTDPDTAITGAWARDELWTAGAPAPGSGPGPAPSPAEN